MKYLITFVLVFFLSFVNAQQQGINENLKKELDEILRLDQTYRKLFENNVTAEEKSKILKELNIDEKEFQEKQWQLVIKQDSLNMQKIEKIISQYGYPGKTLVGEPTNKAAWFVIQHSNKIGKYLPIVKKAGKKGELPLTNVAMMEDRFLMENGKEQIYGTQGHSSFYEKDGKGYQTEDIIWPIKNSKTVNRRRKKAGFSQTIQQYAKDLYGENFIYKIYTLDDVKNKKIEAKLIEDFETHDK
ncbi:hypothetical protein LNP04_14130 [Chryseobacterium sp. C-71]|uniref:DUF6624 domain-containing protein n=1 Tax=Chryseobacterium sp. C-71 TaxID=2893882 RepID=UPI001E39ACF8|nr:DUF6624 domain-containing protein [Chryseobacterium sp. C-71]UFH31106.1 hypothetical protein LNP04_14130 [Chryseobacterium sp. C-71]